MIDDSLVAACGSCCQDPLLHPCCQVPPRRLWGNRDQSTLEYRHFREYISLQAPLPKPGRMPTWGLVAGQWELLSRLVGQDPLLHPCRQLPSKRLWGNRDQSTLMYRHCREWISPQTPSPPKAGKDANMGLGCRPVGVAVMVGGPGAGAASILPSASRETLGQS